MPSSKFQQLAKTIARRDKPVFDALLEYEKSKRVRSKERLNFTVDIALADSFRRYCREHGLNMSAQIENTMREKLTNKRKK